MRATQAYSKYVNPRESNMRLQDVAAVIERKVASMIAQATARAAGGAEDAARGKLPLVRLRIDYTGFSTINAQRFGQKFVGRVANPHDMLLFHKAAARKVKVST